MSEQEDDLTTEELLSMWKEGQPVTIVTTRLEVEAFPWMREFDTASLGLRPSQASRRYVGHVSPRESSTGLSAEELARSA